MKKLLYVGMLAIAISYLLASCVANDEMANTPMYEKKEVALTTSLDFSSCKTFMDENLDLFYTVYDANNGAVVKKNTVKGEETISLLYPNKISSDLHQIDEKGKTIEVEATLCHLNIEKQPLVFTAGRAWLTRKQTILAKHCI